jgi:hypothetical protein
LHALERVLTKLRADGATLHVAYEAGPTGFVIYRHLQKMGIDCLVVAPSKVPVPGGKRQKTDRRDAELLARLLRAGELTSIGIPDEVDESIRDLTRTRSDAVDDLRRAKQRLKSFLRALPTRGSCRPQAIRRVGILASRRFFRPLSSSFGQLPSRGRKKRKKAKRRTLPSPAAVPFGLFRFLSASSQTAAEKHAKSGKSACHSRRSTLRALKPRNRPIAGVLWLPQGRGDAEKTGRDWVIRKHVRPLQPTPAAQVQARGELRWQRRAPPCRFRFLSGAVLEGEGDSTNGLFIRVSAPLRNPLPSLRHSTVQSPEGFSPGQTPVPGGKRQNEARERGDGRAAGMARSVAKGEEGGCPRQRAARRANRPPRRGAAGPAVAGRRTDVHRHPRRGR